MMALTGAIICVIGIFIPGETGVRIIMSGNSVMIIALVLSKIR